MVHGDNLPICKFIQTFSTGFEGRILDVIVPDLGRCLLNFPFIATDKTLSNVLTDHLNILAYIKAWFLPNNKIKLLLLYYTMT